MHAGLGKVEGTSRLSCIAMTVDLSRSDHPYLPQIWVPAGQTAESDAVRTEGRLTLRIVSAVLDASVGEVSR